MHNLGDAIAYACIAALGSVVGGFISFGSVLFTTPLFSLYGDSTIDFRQVGFLNLLMIFVSTIISLSIHSKAGNVDLFLGKRVIFTGVLGSLLGTLLIRVTAEWVLRGLFVGLILLSLCVVLPKTEGRLLRGVRKVLRLDGSRESLTIPLLVTTFLISSISGLIGVGGGMLLAPMLIKVFSIRAHQVLGTMAFYGLFVTATSLLGRIGTVPLPPWPALLGVIAGAVVGTAIGVQLVIQVPEGIVVVAISTFVVLSALGTLAGEFAP